MTRYQVVTATTDGHTVYLLRDLQSGALARIVPALGANCLELRLAAGDEGPVVAVIDDMKHLGEIRKQPSRYGIPVLFPWPSGIPEGEFMFNKKLYRMNDPGDDKTRHHGFVNRATWRAVRSDCDNTGAWLTCAIDSKDCGDAGRRFPFSFTLEITFRLHDGGFQIDTSARNTGDSVMPFGMGLHPYFTVPFGEKGSRAACRLSAMVGRQWDLGVTVPIRGGAAKPSTVFMKTPEVDITGDGGTLMADRKLNDVYEARFGPAQTTSATIIDPVNKVSLRVTASRDYKTWVFYTPPDRDAISLEPWTLTANGFNLAASGVEEAGLLTLQPGQVWNGQVAINLESE